MNKIIILDRDGIINKLLINSFGEIDSPMNLEQVEVFHYIPSELKELCNLGYNLAIATNQPAAAKDKVSMDQLKLVHNHIMKIAKSQGASFFNECICFHKAQDNCLCRKPKTGLLEMAFGNNNFDKNKSWMVGDRATDIIAGFNFGLQTALLGPSVKSDLEQLKSMNIIPVFQGLDIRDFVETIRCIEYNKFKF
jgi:histidinol-phosphate phosphatase family protein